MKHTPKGDVASGFIADLEALVHRYEQLSMAEVLGLLETYRFAILHRKVIDALDEAKPPIRSTPADL